jgi:zinc protease
MRASARLPPLLAALTVAAACVKPGETLKLPEVPYQSELTTFSSGLRLVAVQTPQPGRFMVSLSFPAGSGDDPAGREGLAHLVEHLTYRARAEVDGPRVAEALAASGWRYDAMTFPDSTDYWSAGPPPDLDAALALEARRLRTPLLGVGTEELERERAVVQSELREYQERAPARDALVERAFPEHPYGHGPRGSEESVDRATLEDVRAFAGEHYAPGGAILTVVSPFAPEDTRRRVEAAFGELAREGVAGKAQEPLARRRPPTARPPREPRLVTGPVERPSLWVGWSAPGRYDRATPDPDLVAAALEAVVLRRLQAHHLGDDVGAVQTGFTDVGELGLAWVKIDLRREAVARTALEAIREAVGELPRVGEPPRAFRDWVLVDGFLALEQLDPDAAARYLRATGDGDYVTGWQRWSRRRFDQPLHDYAKEWIRSDRTASVLLAPDRNVSEREIDRAVATGPQPPPIDAPPPPAGGDRRMEDEASAVTPATAALNLAPSPGLDAAERRTLSNGLTVVIARRPTLPVAEVRLVVRTAAAGSPGVPPLVAELALSHSLKGFSAQHASGVGASTSTAVGWEKVVVRRRGTSRDLGEMLQSVADWAREQKLDAPAVERSRRALQRREEWIRTTPSRRAWNALREQLFPRHPYGADPRIEGLLQLTAGQAQRWIDTQLRPDRSTLIVVSDRPATPELWREIEGAFGGWERARGGPPELAAPPLPEARTVTVVHRPGATQALLIVGLRAPESRRRDLAGYDAARWLLTSRLNRRLRMEEGTSYGVASFTLDYERAAAMVLTASVDAPDAATSLHTMLDAAAALRDDPIDPAAVARARWVLTREFSYRFDSVAGVAAALERLAVDGRPADAWEEQPRSIVGLTPERVGATARELAVGHEAVVVLANAPAVVPALRSAGFIVKVEELPPAD